MNTIYPAHIKYDSKEKRYTVQFLDLSEAITEAETITEAIANASEVLTLTLEGRMDENMEIPLPQQPENNKNIYWIAPSVRVQAALLVKVVIQNKEIKITKAQLARTMQTSWPAVARLENPHHWPNLRQLEKAATLMGQKLVLSFMPTQELAVKPKCEN